MRRTNGHEEARRFFHMPANAYDVPVLTDEKENVEYGVQMIWTTDSVTALRRRLVNSR